MIRGSCFYSDGLSATSPSRCPIPPDHLCCRKPLFGLPGGKFLCLKGGGIIPPNDFFSSAAVFSESWCVTFDGVHLFERHLRLRSPMSRRSSASCVGERISGLGSVCELPASGSLFFMHLDVGAQSAGFDHRSAPVSRPSGGAPELETVAHRDQFPDTRCGSVTAVVHRLVTRQGEIADFVAM